MTIESFDVVYYTCIFLLPGFVIKSIIDLLVPTQRHNDAKYFLSCLLYSIINCALFSWAYKLAFYIYAINLALYWITLVVITIVGAIIISFSIAVVRQKNLVSRFLNLIGIRNIHPTPTAWDFFFSKQEPAWIIITLKSGKTVYGLYHADSFASSDGENRDIYIEKLYSIDEHQNWIEDESSKGVLILQEDIEIIEFFSLGGNKNG